MKEIGSKIRQLRELKGYTQDYMAHQMGISQRAYSKIENNETRINWDKLTKVSEILEIKPADITNFDDNLIFNHCTQEQAGKNLTINKASELLIQQFQERIQHLEQEIEFLRNQLK
ncbi:MAG TPA: helix-turn-helix transcriptional regulator [Arachidicoccus soli]|nr:helix-turn-helix transcriptional regulator [Arachidicoccus soli]